MDNKLSELSKPVQIFKHPAGRNHWAVSADSNAGQRDVEPFYSQEYVSALDGVAQFWIGESAGWKKRAEDAEKRIAELEQTMRHIHGAVLDITVPRVAIAKAAELAVEHAAMKERSNG